MGVPAVWKGLLPESSPALVPRATQEPVFPPGPGLPAPRGPLSAPRTVAPEISCTPFFPHSACFLAEMQVYAHYAPIPAPSTPVSVMTTYFPCIYARDKGAPSSAILSVIN